MPRLCGVNVCLSYRFCDGMIQLTLWCHPADAELHPKVKLREPALSYRKFPGSSSALGP